jgi:O-methyltransferase
MTQGIERRRSPGAWLRRHVARVRFLIAQYRALGGWVGFDHAELFLNELPARRDFFRRAFHYLAWNGIEGDYAEFGCFGGTTFRLAWNASRLTGYQGHLWGFDSFEGLPASSEPKDEHPKWTASWLATPLEEFRRLCTAAGIPEDRYTAVPGFYHETLREGAAGPRPQRISLAYVDCDLYSSTVEVLDFLEARLRPGSVVGFDDWFCYSPTGPSGERLAALEHYAHSTWSLVPFLQYGWHGMSFLVEERAVEGRAAAGQASSPW